MAKGKGIGLMIAVGKDAPPPRYKGRDEQEKPEPEKSPTPTPDPAPAPKPSPAPEPTSEYAEKLLSDMTAPLIQAGLEDGDAKEMLAQIFEAAATCLRSGGNPAAATAEPVDDDNGGY